MLHEVSGDILKTKAAVIAHGVAPNDPFHSGLALQLREQFPAMYKDFRHHCQTAHPKAGEIWSWAGAGHHGPVQLVALMTQEGGYEHGAKPGHASLNNVGHSGDFQKLAAIFANRSQITRTFGRAQTTALSTLGAGYVSGIELERKSGGGGFEYRVKAMIDGKEFNLAVDAGTLGVTPR